MPYIFRVAPLVCRLLLVNIGLFIAASIAEDQGNYFGIRMGMFYFDSPNFRWYQIITHMFMHGNTAHIFFNMFALFTFGIQLEGVWGSKRFLIFYFATGFGAIFLHQAVQAYEVYQIMGTITPLSNHVNLTMWDLSELRPIYSPVIGASGAVYGVLMGFVVLFPNAKLAILFLPIPIAAKYIVPVLMLVELYLGLQQFEWDNIAHFAHLGGAIIGFILVNVWMRGKTLVYRE